MTSDTPYSQLRNGNRIEPADASPLARRTGSPFKLQRIVDNVAALRQTRDERRLAKPFIYVKMIDTGDQAENTTPDNLDALSPEVYLARCAANHVER